MEYGALFYDIPKKHIALYSKIYRKIGGHALRENWSVYLIDWGMRKIINSLIKELEDDSGFSVHARFRKYDPSEEAELRKAAESSLRELITRQHRGLSLKLAKAATALKEAQDDEGKERALSRRRSALYAAKKALERAESLAVIFALTEQMESYLSALRSAISAELQADLAQKGCVEER